MLLSGVTSVDVATLSVWGPAVGLVTPLATMVTVCVAVMVTGVVMVMVPAPPPVVAAVTVVMVPVLSCTV